MARDTTIKNPSAAATYKQKAFVGSLVCQLLDAENMGDVSSLIDALRDDKAAVQVKVGTKVHAKS